MAKIVDLDLYDIDTPRDKINDSVPHSRIEELVMSITTEALGLQSHSVSKSVLIEAIEISREWLHDVAREMESETWITNKHNEEEL